MSRKLTVSVFLLTVASCWFLGTRPASAVINLNPDPGAAGIPANLRNYLRNCDGGGQSPAFVQWLSQAGNPSVTTLNVTAGQPFVNVDLRFAGAVCFSPSSTLQTQLRVMGSSVTPNGSVDPTLTGRTLNITFSPNQNAPGTYRFAATQFRLNAPAGGFQGNVRYFLTLDNRVINRFPTRHECVTPPSPVVNGWNFAGCPPSGVILAIQINAPPPPVDAGNCSVSAPSGIYPGSTFAASFVANNTGDFNWSVNNATPQRWRMRDPSFNGQWGAASETEIRGGEVRNSPFGQLLFGGDTANWTQNFTAPGTPGRYTFDWRIFRGGVGYLGAICSQTIDVIERPYFRTYGGDVFVGGGQGAGCAPPDTDAGILGVTHTTHTAAGSQLANFALGFIMETASAQVRNGGANPKDLSFANTNPQLDGAIPGAGLYTTYGGGLNTGSVVCAPDFWVGATSIQPAGYRQPATNLGMGQRRTVYVDGDAFIDGNITYANGNYANLGQIPSFRLIARGNIYVAPGVSELNGLFVAQPRAGAAANTTGRFYTCYPGHIPTAADMNGVCRSTDLTVYGAVVAELIKLTRSGGSAHQSTAAERYTNTLGTAAERFIYTPEVWLTSDFGGSGEFNSLRSLPPVL
ncbi:MAG TPA: hypothetical protein VK674_05345 [Candidatus Limnocylindria bacterium]|nr:hypothetical protein [Candidatus Limnocylindria bacterium]